MQAQATARESRLSSAPPSAVRAFLEEHRQELLGLLGSRKTAGVVLAQRHAAIMDHLLMQLYQAAAARVPEVRRDGLLLAAVGGYGRRLLGCKSDLDVRFITNGRTDKLGAFVESMVYPMWDAGMSIGHQVVNVGDAVRAAKGDLPTATALLDVRTLMGSARLASDLNDRAYGSVFSDGQLPGFLASLEAQAHERFERFGDSVYLLEPDVKNGTGGLRDLDLALWAARARFRTSDLTELHKLGVISELQARDVTLACDFLWAVRNHLHTRAGRRSDRLTFGEQEAIAPLFGYEAVVGSLPAKSETSRLAMTVEAFMSDYYRHARVITHVRDQVIERAKRRQRRFAPRNTDIGNGLLTCEGSVGLRDPALLKTDPALALRMYAAAVARDMPVLSPSREAVMRAAADAGFAAALRVSTEAATLFMTLVATCRQTRFRNGSILSELHDVGLVVAMIPEFAPVVGRVHHDLYHVYTVDVHSVAAVDRLRALSRGDLIAEQPLACRLAAELPRPHVLFMATLLHDIGKVIGWQDHATRGAELARPILARFGMSEDDIDDACHLIQNHLRMYLVAVQRDLADPTTLDAFVRETRGHEGLRALYVLTVADLSTTGPASMTKWKAAMLEALLRESEASLSARPLEGSTRASRVREDVRLSWSHSEGRGAIDHFLDGMPERYLLANTPSAIAAHASIALEAGADVVTASLVPSSNLDMAELCVVTGTQTSADASGVSVERPGLLAAIAAAISANGLEIHAAQVNSRKLPDGGVQAVDVFWVRSPARGAAGVTERLPKLQQDLRDLTAGRKNARELLAQPRASRVNDRTTPTVSTEVVIDHDASSEHTVIEVLTADRPALLFMLAQALHEIDVSIHVAKINTEGSRVIDVFYVTESNGQKLDPGARSEQVRTSLAAALQAG